MKNLLFAFVCSICLFLTGCHRPTAYFQRTAHSPAARLPVSPGSAQPAVDESPVLPGVNLTAGPTGSVTTETVTVASQTTGQLLTADQQVRQHSRRIASLLTSTANDETRTVGQQPKPKPKPKMRLGNRIRDALGMPLREELNWWQRISWKLKASVIIILVAVLFAILHVTILAIIFGIVGAFLLISGLRRSFKVRRPWF